MTKIGQKKSDIVNIQIFPLIFLLLFFSGYFYFIITHFFYYSLFVSLFEVFLNNVYKHSVSSLFCESKRFQYKATHSIKED